MSLPVLSSLILAVLFGFPWLSGHYLLFTDLAFLGGIVQVEFIVLASGFLFMLPLIIRGSSADRPIPLAVRVIFFVLPLPLPIWGAWESMGLWGIIPALLAVHSTFGSVLLPKNVEELRVTRAFGYWILNFCVFALFAGMSHMPKHVDVWEERESVLKLGFLFFTYLSLLRLFNPFPRLIEIVSTWNERHRS